MIKEKELELLIDIQKLINKYGEKTFIDLVNTLKNGDFINGIESLGKSIFNKEKSSEKINYKTELDLVVFNLDKEKQKTLKSLIKNIDKKYLFKTIDDFSSYLNETNIYKKNIKTWIHGKYIFINALSEKKHEDIIFILNKLEEVHTTDERSLEGWSDIILSKKG